MNVCVESLIQEVPGYSTVLAFDHIADLERGI
jgi:hypothetical protein